MEHTFCRSRLSLSQEALKWIACAAMLLDHSAVALVTDYNAYILMRSIGRIAFPIYCFLLCEGVAHTSDLRRYALRLAAGALLSEVPFDMVIGGGLTFGAQNVMLTLLLGLGALALMERSTLWLQPVILLLFTFAGELLAVDYGGMGVLLIALLGILRPLPQGKLLQLAAIALVCAGMPSMDIRLFGVCFSMELLGAFSIIPIALYRGEKRSRSKPLQLAFYLFYPVHLMLLYLLSRFL